MRRSLLALLLVALAPLALGQTTGTLTILPSGAAGTLTTVGACTADPCFQTEAALTFFAAPPGGGVAAFRAITEADLPAALATDLELTAAISAHAAIAAAHHAWPLTDAEVPNTITVDLATSATTATTANAGDSATGFFPAGTLEHERGGLEADVSTFGGLVRIAAGATSAVSTLAGLNTALGSSIADGAHTVDTDTFAGYTPTGADLGVVTGTAGGAGICAEWNVDGDLVAAASAVACGSGSGGPATAIDQDADATPEVSATGTVVDIDQNDDGLYDARFWFNSTFPVFEIRDRGAATNLERWAISGEGNAGAGTLTIGLLNDAGTAWTAQHVLRMDVGNNIVYTRYNLRKTEDANTGLTWSAADVVGLTAGGMLGISQSATETTLAVEQVNAPASQTCTSSGDASPGTLIASVSGLTFKKVTNSDPDGCTLILSETGATDGQRLEVIVVSNAGGTLTASDAAGVQEAGAGCAMAINGASTWRYNGTAWILTGCQPTN